MSEVVVVGAGMVGTATALALQERGYDVTLVDRSSPGRETSYGNAGIIQGEAHEPYAMPRDIKTLTRIVLKADNSVNWDARGLWRSGPSLWSYWRHSNPVKHQGIAVAYSQLIRRATHDHGELITASGAEELIRRDGFRSAFRDSRSFEAQLDNAARLRDLYGVEFDCEDSEALSAAEPALRKRLAGAIRWRDAWTCSDPGALVQAYAKLFARRGGKLLELEVRTLEQVASRWRLHTGEGTIDTAQIVIALGPWSPNLLATLGYKVRMVPKRGYHLNFRYASEGTTPRLDLPLLDTSIGAVYAPMRAGLRVATGADLSSFRDSVVPRQMLRAEAAVRELLDIGQPIETSVWTGVRPCMPDMMPLIGPAPRHRGLWLNFGHGHQGFTLGPTTGALLAEAMADGTTEGVPSIAAWRTFR